ncbi:MAG: hypothetical protein ABIP48_10240, partial [Planctomycetota bacterium]
MTRCRLSLPLALVVLVGCGPRAQFTGSSEPEKDAAERTKVALEQLVETGQMGSEIALMMGALEEMNRLSEDLLSIFAEFLSSPVGLADGGRQLERGPVRR